MEKEKQHQEEENTIQKIQERAKKALFRVNNHLLKHLASFNHYIYFALILIQSIQILWFSIHPTFDFISDSIGMKELQLGIRYFNVQYYMRENPGAWEFCMLVAFSLTMVHIISIAITAYFLSQDVISETGELLAKITNAQIILMNTVLTGPFFNIVVTTLYCDPTSPYHTNQTCYDPRGIAYCVLACIVGLVLIIEGALYAFIFYIKNPFTRDYLSTPSNIYYVAKFWLKTLPSLYFIIDPGLQYVHVYIFAYVIIFAGFIFFFRMFSTHSYNQKYYYFIYTLQIALTWIGLVNILQFYLSEKGPPNLCLIFSLIGIYPLSYTLIKLQRQSKKKVFLEGIRNLKKNKEIAEEFVYMIITLIETVSIHKNKIQLLGFIKIHNGGCEEDKKCNCHSFLESFYQKTKFTPEQQLQIFYQFLKNLLLDYIKKYSGSTIFKIIYAYLLYYKLQSKIQAIHYVTQTGKQKLSFAQEFLICRLKLLFEEESKQKQNDLGQDKGHAVKTYLQFNRIYLELQKQIGLCAKNNLQYWRQLAEDFPSVLKLWNLAKYFEIQTKNAQRLFNEIIQIFPNNINTLLLYSNFLRYIVLDQKQYSKLNQKIRSQKFSVQSNTKDVKDMKFRQNSNLCLITITTTASNMGMIINSNSEIQKMLGYYKNQIIGQKVTKIMPKVYYDLHDGFVLNYINRTDKQIQTKQFIVFAICRKGFLVQCNILTKLVPDIQNGFYLVGFLKKVEETSRYVPHYIMYDGDTINIQAISETCVESLGLTSDSIFNGGASTSQITVNYLFPQVDFQQLDNRPQLKIEGFETMIDTRVINDDFVPFQSLEDNSQMDDKNGRKMNAKVYLLKQSNYGKLKLKFLKFFILNQEEQPNQASKKQLQQEDNCSSDCKETEDNQDGQAGFQKKYKSFVSESSTKCLLSLLVAAVIVFMGMQISLVSYHLAQNLIDSNQISFSMQVLNQSNAIILCINNANFDVRKIHLTKKINLTQAEYNRYLDHMNNTIQYMQQEVVSMIRTLVVLQDKYNFVHKKLYHEYYFYNSGDDPISQTFQYYDAVFQYITTVTSLVNNKYPSFNLNNIINTSILSNLFFVEENGITTLTNNTSVHLFDLKDFFIERYNLYLKNRQILLGLRIASVMIIFFLILPIIIKLDKVNRKLLGIYKLIPLDDIRIIQANSQKFITKNFEDMSISKIKGVSDLSKDYNKLSRSHIQEPLDEQKEGEIPLQSAINSNRYQISPSSTFRPALTQDGLLMSMDEQKLSLKRNTFMMDGINDEEQKKKIPKVRLSQIPSSNNQIISLSIAVIIFFAYFMTEYYMHQYYFEPFKQDTETFVQYKIVTSLTRQCLLFAQQIVSSGKTVLQFKIFAPILYQTLDSLYNILPDVQKNREVIYGSMQQLKYLLETPTIQILSSPKFQIIQSSLDKVQVNLINEANQLISNVGNQISGNFQKACYIKFFVEIIVIGILLKILFSNYLDKVKMRTHRSTSMALMIPMKIVVKNPDIAALL